MIDAPKTLAPFTREFLSQFQPRTRTVDMPDFGTSATVRELRSGEATEFQRRQAQSPDKAMAYLLRTAVVDPAGQPVFDETSAIDGLPSKVTDTLTRAIVELSFTVPAAMKSTPAGD